jgi:hypothetical protein
MGVLLMISKRGIQIIPIPSSLQKLIFRNVHAVQELFTK